jgi:hypothetical protein
LNWIISDCPVCSKPVSKDVEISRRERIKMWIRFSKFQKHGKVTYRVVRTLLHQSFLSHFQLYLYYDSYILSTWDSSVYKSKFLHEDSCIKGILG